MKYYVAGLLALVVVMPSVSMAASKSVSKAELVARIQSNSKLLMKLVEDNYTPDLVKQIAGYKMLGERTINPEIKADLIKTGLSGIANKRSDSKKAMSLRSSIKKDVAALKDPAMSKQYMDLDSLFTKYYANLSVSWQNGEAILKMIPANDVSLTEFTSKSQKKLDETARTTKDFAKVKVQIDTNYKAWISSLNAIK